ncbi:CRISPR-associated endonuclease Cas2 [Methanococcus voltae]|uniref:CRISPR-associated endoribonuclease Cas2 n=1 Tax=Methanococcus voltae TaxID=2188 RepID=A0A8J7UVB2_METVO|nr:CRISPR-associated protein Cas2 [Methanococcus voltae]MBP2202231.1 CRISPR-associated protein Cas2 [Methanococcus voltae]
MILWVIYDIKEDKVRTKIAKSCLNFGLYRVQKSVFLGDVAKSRFEELKLISKDIINPETDSVYFLPTSKEFIDKSYLIGQSFDEELVLDEITSKFF